MSTVDHGMEAPEPDEIDEGAYRVPVLLGASIVSVGTSAACLAGGSLAIHFVGYVLASVLAFGCVAAARRLAVQRALKTGIGPDGRLAALSMGVLAAGLVLAVLNVWLIARHYG